MVKSLTKLVLILEDTNNKLNAANSIEECPVECRLKYHIIIRIIKNRCKSPSADK